MPCQFLMGAFLLIISFFGTEIMGGGKQHSVLVKFSADGEPNTVVLMLVFLVISFLAATQDVAVDGWALTMLSRFLVGKLYKINLGKILNTHLLVMWSA